MPKLHPPQRRKCLNETQFRHWRDGYFLRRLDDDRVTTVVSMAGMHKEGVEAARARTEAAWRRKGDDRNRLCKMGRGDV